MTEIKIDTKPLPICEGSGRPTRGYMGSKFCSVCGLYQPRSVNARKHPRHPDPEVSAEKLAERLSQL